MYRVIYTLSKQTENERKKEIEEEEEKEKWIHQMSADDL